MIAIISYTLSFALTYREFIVKLARNPTVKELNIDCILPSFVTTVQYFFLFTTYRRFHLVLFSIALFNYLISLFNYLIVLF